MIIVVIDVGYYNVDKIEVMKNICILGMKDFVELGSDIYVKGLYGMVVFFCMVMNDFYVMVGMVFEVFYWLFCSEDEVFEYLVE